MPLLPGDHASNCGSLLRTGGCTVPAATAAADVANQDVLQKVGFLPAEPVADQAPDWHQDPVARCPGRVEEESAHRKEQILQF
jgi:hypothetical protein